MNVQRRGTHATHRFHVKRVSQNGTQLGERHKLTYRKSKPDAPATTRLPSGFAGASGFDE